MPSQIVYIYPFENIEMLASHQYLKENMHITKKVHHFNLITKLWNI